MRAVERVAGPEVIPLALGQIHGARRSAFVSDRINHERRPVHELVADILRAHVRAEIHYQRPHGRVAIVRDHPRERINVRHQAVAQAVEAGENLLRVGPIGPDLVCVSRARAVDAEDRAERAVLEPAHEELAIGGIIRIADDEAADVGRPVRETGEFEIEAGGNLAAEAQPVRFDVAGPRGYGIALRAGKSGAREDEDALLIGGGELALRGALAIVDTGRVHEGKHVRVARAIAEKYLFCFENVLLAVFRFGLVGIEPPGVGANGEYLVEKVPVVFAGGGIERVVESLAIGMNISGSDDHLVDEIAFLFHFFVNR